MSGAFCLEAVEQRLKYEAEGRAEVGTAVQARDRVLQARLLTNKQTKKPLTTK